MFLLLTQNGEELQKAIMRKLPAKIDLGQSTLLIRRGGMLCRC